MSSDDGLWGLEAGVGRWQAPHPQSCHASAAATRAMRAGTYRPRSVSSLLMRLRAMVAGVWWCCEVKSVGRVRVGSVGVGDG